MRSVEPEAIGDVIWLRSIEECDRRGEVLPFEAREAASCGAAESMGAGLGDGAEALSERDWAYLVERVRRLRGAMRSVAAMPSWVRHLRWWPAAFGLAAFVTGFGSHYVGLDRSFDLLSGPVLLVLLWNTVVCAHAVTSLFGGEGRPRTPAMAGWVARWLQGRAPSAGGGEGAAIGACAWERYGRLWWPWAGGWLARSVAGWLHGAGLCFVLGLVGGVYWRGLASQYLAGWESTWLGPREVGAFLGALLWPASAVTGIALPSETSGWEALRRGSGFAGVPAGPWIHLYATTLMLYVGAPRFLLLCWSALDAARAVRTPPRWTRREAYVRRVLASAKKGSAVRVAVLPFDVKRPARLADGAFRDAVGRLAREIWGSAARVDWGAGASYGEESVVWEGPWRAMGDAGAGLIVMDATATPEAEVHGMVLGAVAAQFSGRDGVVVGLECAGLGVERVASRLDIWKRMAGMRGLKVLALQCGEPADSADDPMEFVWHG